MCPALGAVSNDEPRYIPIEGNGDVELHAAASDTTSAIALLADTSVKEAGTAKAEDALPTVAVTSRTDSTWPSRWKKRSYHRRIKMTVIMMMHVTLYLWTMCGMTFGTAR